MFAGTPGITRMDLYVRFIRAAREVLERDIVQESREPEMVMKINIQDTLNRLVVCPVCASRLETYADYPLERSCSCGDFTIISVYTNGDIEFTFKMNGPEAASQETTAPVDDGV